MGQAPGYDECSPKMRIEKRKSAASVSSCLVLVSAALQCSQFDHGDRSLISSPSGTGPVSLNRLVNNHSLTANDGGGANRSRGQGRYVSFIWRKGKDYFRTVQVFG